MSSRVLGRFNCDGKIYTKYLKGGRAKERFSGRKASWTEAMTQKHIQRSLGTAQKAEGGARRGKAAEFMVCWMWDMVWGGGGEMLEATVN